MADRSSKEVVISMRTALKAGHNLPLLVFGDNAFTIIDESKEATFTKWDDTNGVVYYFRLMSPQQEQGLNAESAKAISVSAIKYEFIQAMEVAPMPLKYLDDIFNSIDGEIGSGGSTMKPEFKAQIKHVFESYTDSRMALTPQERNAIHGAKIVQTSDDYYNGTFYEKFKESRDTEFHNRPVQQG